MARLPIDKARLSRLAGRSVAQYIDLVHRTSRLVTEPEDVRAFVEHHRPAIIAVWHGQFLMAPKVKPLDVPLRIVLARHGDAELYAYALARFNTELIRGAGANGRLKDRGGAHALRAALRALEENVHVALTADVPPGPARRAGEGIVALARLSGRPIIPLAAATSRYHALNTWSRMTINLPFGRLAGVFGEPIWVPRDADAATLEAARLAVEEGLDVVTRRAFELAHADPRRATPPRQETARAQLSAPGRGLRAYTAATQIMKGAAPLLLGLRERRGREDRARRAERLGHASTPRPDGQLVWMHAASVGELNAVMPLITALRAERPSLRFLVTTGTVTSAALAMRRLGPGDVHQYVPLDVPEFVRRFLQHWQPDLAVLTESEIWPNLLFEASARNIPLALVNARMSNRSYGRWRRFPRLSHPLFGRFEVILAQNEKLARRFGELGARRSIAVGNLKIDSPPPPVDETELQRLRRALDRRPVFVCASTHEGEEQIIAEAHRALARRVPGICTVIAPRHPERGTGIAEALKGGGLNVCQRSMAALPAADTDVYVADTIGELGTLFALAPVAFVGNSLIARGGHNPIEAIRHGAVVLTGPNWQNFADAYDALIKQQGVVVVKDAAEMAQAVASLLADPAALARLRTGAEAALSRLSGALARTVDELLKHLPIETELRRAS